MEEPGFWDDPDRSTRLVREAKNLKDEVGTFRELEQEYEDIQVMIQMGYEENDPSVIPDIQEMLDHFTETLEKMRMKLLLSGEYDSSSFPNSTLVLWPPESSVTSRSMPISSKPRARPTSSTLESMI